MARCPICASSQSKLIAVDRVTSANQYLRCLTCGSGFSQNREADISESSRLHTKTYYSPGDSGPQPVPAADAFFCARLLKLIPSGRLLDIGCGRGHWTAYIRNHSPFEVLGLEISEKASSYARTHYSIQVITGDIHSEGLQPRSFDVIYLRHVLEHITHPVPFISAVHGLLKDNGICVVHVPNDVSLTNSLKRMLYRRGLISECGSLFYPIHVNGFTPSSLTCLMGKLKFKICSVMTISKMNRIYDFPLSFQDLPLLPVAALESLFNRGNIIVGWFRK